ncbi:MAG: DUF4347 domain-containing protein, partial [Gallionella sp.]|nr:DUF4347 domain-containing protein [Gallionella sp.]
MKATALPKRPAGQPATNHQNKLAVRCWLQSLAGAWRALSSPAPHACVPLIEEYEPRLLYSADFAASGLALVAGCQVTEQRVLDDSGEFIQNQTSQTNVTVQQHELVIIDASVPDINGLVAGLDTKGRNIEIVILDANKDGIEQISAALAGRTDLSAVHIVSHGSDGHLQLGSTTLASSQLNARSAEISRWGDALTSDADILLYGCDVAAGAQGGAFVQHLASLTRADVAASDDLTGNTALGGNWKLEYQAGSIETRIAVSQAEQQAWMGVLESGGLWLSVANTATTSAGSGALTFNDGQIARFTDPNLALGGGTTAGTFSQ